jgi:hypothetical protein
MGNLKFYNVNVEYDLYFKFIYNPNKIATMTIQIVYLFVLSLATQD